MSAPGPHRVVVVGGGFGGLHAVRGIRRLPVEITLVDRRNFHLFQPLTYQVATGSLSPGDISYPLRALYKRDRNVRVLLSEVTGIDVSERRVQLAPAGGVAPPSDLTYDTLIVAAGSSYSYFGHEEWREAAAEVKSLESATAVRSQLLRAFEQAEIQPHGALREGALTFVVVGGGPTGVEMAGQIGELARDTLRRDFRSIDPRDAQVLIVEAADRLLTSFPPSLSARAAAALERLGVTPLLGTTVVDITAEGVVLAAADGARRLVPSDTVIWAAGVRASSLAELLAQATATEVDAAGRVLVEPDLTLRGHPEVIALGDMVRVSDGRGGVLPLLGVAPVAIQQGRHAAGLVRDRLRGAPLRPFRYRDKGNVATIGRGKAVADLGVVRLSGLPAWLVWIAVHIWYLIGFRNRLLVSTQWALSYLTRARGARLITESPARPAGPE